MKSRIEARATIATWISLVSLWSCSKEHLEKPPWQPDTTGDQASDSETDSAKDSQSADSDSGTDITTDTESESDVGQETDTGDEPPDLPERCSIALPSTALGGAGDGKAPTIEEGDPPIAAWSYYDAKEANATRLLVALLGDEADTDTAEVAPSEPASPGKGIAGIALARRGAELGVLWTDARWNAKCQEPKAEGCTRDLAFLRLDAEGRAIGSAEPTRLTFDVTVRGRPALEATANGYLAVWNEQGGSWAYTMAMPIDAAGNPGKPSTVSSSIGADQYNSPSLATRQDSAAAIFLSPDQHGVYVCQIALDGTPLAEPVALETGKGSLSPRLVATKDGYLAAWSRSYGQGFEGVTAVLAPSGELAGTIRRATWSKGTVPEVALAKADDASFAIAWLSSKKQGVDECAVSPSCNDQVFITLLDVQGAAASAPLQLTTDPNPAKAVNLIFDGRGWTSVFELRRYLRQQVFYGRIQCDATGR